MYFAQNCAAASAVKVNVLIINYSNYHIVKYQIIIRTFCYEFQILTITIIQ
jgi:hypothetical protein